MTQKRYPLRGGAVGLLIGIGWSIISIYNSYVTTSSEIAQYQVLFAPFKVLLGISVGVVAGIIYKEVKNRSNEVR